LKYEIIYPDLRGYLIVNKEEAIEALENGETLTHKYFTPEEWMKMREGYILFEDGCQCTPIEFWQNRTEDFFQKDWKIYTEKA
jgi:hypothetical protein